MIQEHCVAKRKATSRLYENDSFKYHPSFENVVSLDIEFQETAVGI